MKLSPFYLLIFLWINANGQYVAANKDGDPRFFEYQKCMVNTESWKLLGPHFNQTYYDTFNNQSNKMLDRSSPLAIFTPTSSADVQSAVKCGVKTQIQLVPISGGHSYAGLSIAANDSINIYFRYMNDVSINHDEMTATVETGTLLGKLYGELWKNGGLGAALGSCTTVAMGGLALGGGIGFFSTMYGLVIDNLVEINMVDARGNAITVNETHNEDLWWAMRGVGPGYIGLVTSVKLKVFKADDLKFTYLKLRFNNTCFKSVMGTYPKWLDWVEKNDPYINSVITIRSDNYPEKSSQRPESNGTVLLIIKLQDPIATWNQERDFISEAIEKFPNYSSSESEHNQSFIDIFNMESYTPVIKYNRSMSIKEKFDLFSSLTKEDRTANYYSAKSFFVKNAYSEKDFAEAQTILMDMPPESGGIMINSERGNIGRPSSQSAYIHRDALFNFKVSFEAQNETEAYRGQQWMERFYESVKFMDSGETFQNYPEINPLTHSRSDQLNTLKRYYGKNLDRLIEIKKKWDPNDYFNSEQSLPIKLP